MASTTDQGTTPADLQAVADDIIAALPGAGLPSELTGRMVAVAKSARHHLDSARWKALLCAGICLEDAQKVDPAIDKEALLRVMANEFIHVAAFFVRAMKRRNGEVISPARFALVACGIAEAVGKQDWSGKTTEGQVAEDIAGDNGGSLRQAIREEAAHQSQRVTDDDLRALWRAYGGEFGNVLANNTEDGFLRKMAAATAGYMPEERLLPFLRMLGAGPEDIP